MHARILGPASVGVWAGPPPPAGGKVHNAGMTSLRDDVLAQWLATAARLVVEEGLEYGPAKQRAARQLGLPRRTAMPDNQALEAAVREHIAIFCPDTQARELAALREVALRWMDRLAEFHPLVGGAVWHGTATAHSDIYVSLFCEDTKTVEWRLIDRRVDYHPGATAGLRGEEIPVLTVRDRHPALAQPVLVHLLVHGRDDDRGALRPDAQGRPPRGDAAALRARMAEAGGEPA
jgi:hypothetical protein